MLSSNLRSSSSKWEWFPSKKTFGDWARPWVRISLRIAASSSWITYSTIAVAGKTNRRFFLVHYFLNKKDGMLCLFPLTDRAVHDNLLLLPILRVNQVYTLCSEQKCSSNKWWGMSNVRRNFYSVWKAVEQGAVGKMVFSRGKIKIVPFFLLARWRFTHFSLRSLVMMLFVSSVTNLIFLIYPTKIFYQQVF